MNLRFLVKDRESAGIFCKKTATMRDMPEKTSGMAIFVQVKKNDTRVSN
jgi:hypothetical protein